MTRDIKFFLNDIILAYEDIQDFTAGMEFQQFIQDTKTSSAVIRQFEIIGEALNQATRADTSLGNRITDTARIIAFRHRLIHGYSVISDEVVWGVVTSSLSRLMDEISNLLEE